MSSTCRFMLASTLGAALVLTTASSLAQGATSTFRLVPSFDLKVLDPIWATAVVTHHHGYMIYDTLNALTLRGINHLRADLEPIARGIVFMGSGGIHATDLRTLPYRNVRRPLWPLDIAS